MAVDAVSVPRQQHCIGFDFELAYLQGKQMACEQRLARPPPGFRVWDERGVEMLWLMQSPLYSQGDAGAIWNRTFTNYAESGRRDSTNSSAWSSDMVCDKSTGPGFDRCDQEPCIYSKEVGRNASRCTLPLYVDDGLIFPKKEIRWGTSRSALLFWAALRRAAAGATPCPAGSDACAAPGCPMGP